MLLATGLSLILSAAGGGYRWYGLAAPPGALPAAGHLAGLFSGLNIVSISCAGFVLLLTPTGTLPSRRWRWWARAAAAAAGVFVLASALTPRPVYPEHPDIGSPIGVPALAESPLDVVVPLAGLVVLVALVIGAGSLVGRFRRARRVERQQLRWLAWGAALAAVASVAAIAELALHGDTPLFQAAVGLCLALLPLATGAAIGVWVDCENDRQRSLVRDQQPHTGGTMERVTGIGGLFFRARDPDALARWYADHLGIDPAPASYEQPPWWQQGPTVLSPFPAETDYFGRPEQAWKLNLRVRDLDAMMAQLRAAGIEVTPDPHAYSNGRLASTADPEGNPIERWEPTPDRSRRIVWTIKAHPIVRRMLSKVGSR